MRTSLVWFVGGLVVAFGVLGGVWAATSGDAEVRVNARRLADGRVEIALQQRDHDGWAERQLPAARFLAPDAEVGRWRSSSPISVQTAGDEQAMPSDADAVPMSIKEAARALLAEELGVDGASLKLASAEAVTWSDASLGCPQPDHGYAQVITPGYRLVFMLGRDAHAVHTDADGARMLRCANGQ